MRCNTYQIIYYYSHTPPQRLKNMVQAYFVNSDDVILIPLPPREPVRVCNVCHKKQSNKTSRAWEVISTLEESMSPNHTNGTAPPPTTTSKLIQPQAPPPPLLPIQHGHSTNSLHQMRLSQNSDGHLSERGRGSWGVCSCPQGLRLLHTRPVQLRPQLLHCASYREGRQGCTQGHPGGGSGEEGRGCPQEAEQGIHDDEV